MFIAWPNRGEAVARGYRASARRHGSARSSLPKGPRDLIPKRFEQVLERGALVGLNESLDWHARNEAHFLQVRNLRRRQRDAARVSFAAAWVTREIGGHTREPAVNHRGCRLLTHLPSYRHCSCRSAKRYWRAAIRGGTGARQDRHAELGL